MRTVNPRGIPDELKNCAQWVLWRVVERDGHVTKLPFQTNGKMSKSNDPATWTTYEQAMSVYLLGSWDGVGFVFSEEDPYCGIDLDGCRNPTTGEVLPWAKELILGFASYAEVSPSETGVKVWVKAGWPYAGNKQILTDVPKIGDKTPAIEVYDRLRYFAVTGAVLKGQNNIAERQGVLDGVRKKFWSEPQPTAKPQDWRSDDAVLDRARKYLAKMPVAVAGQNGHGVTYTATCRLIIGFGLLEHDAYGLLCEWNQGCQPPWSERELRHKIACALKEPGDRGYLRYVSAQEYGRVEKLIPEYVPPKKIIVNSLQDSAAKYLERVRTGSNPLIELGLPELDYSIGGGCEAGEMVLLAARPSHGKSAVSLQFVHHWTAHGRPCLFVSEEMSAMALGKRTVQFATGVHQDYWKSRLEIVEHDLTQHFAERAPCYIAESCLTAEAAAQAIRQAKEEHKIECVVVDYAQLLGSKGHGRYEQITNTSVALRQAATECQVLLVALVQMSRAIEKRDRFVPVMSDIKESGQFEQDADVIIFGVWPHRISSENPPSEYQFYVVKNRNREILSPLVVCKFNPSRQMFGEADPTEEDLDRASRAFGDRTF